MTVYGIQTLLASIINLFLALFVLFNNPRRQINRAFALANIPLAIYNLSAFLASLSETNDEALIVTRALQFGLILIPATFLGFIVQFTTSAEKSHKTLVRIAFGIAFFFQLCNLTPHFVSGVYQHWWGYSIVPGFLFYFFMVYFVFFLACATVILWKEYEQSVGAKKQQYGLSFVALSVLLCLGSINFLPMMKIDIYPIGNISFVIYSIIMTYIIAKHRLMDIRIASRKLMYYIFSVVYWAFSFIVINMLAPNIYVSLGLIIIATLSYEPLRSWSSNLTARLFASAFIYEKELLKLAKEVFSIMDKEQLVEVVKAAISKNMKLENIELIVASKFEEQYPIIADHLKQTLNPLVLDDLKQDGGDNSKLIKELEAHYAAVILPLYEKDQVIGFILLGSKKNNESFFEEDIRILNMISHSISLALANAQQFSDATSQVGQLENVLQSMSHGVITIGLDGRILTINQKAEKILRVTSKKIIGEIYASIWRSEGPNLVEVSLNSDQIYLAEETIFKIENRRLPLQLSTETMFDKRGHKMGILLTIQELAEAHEQKENLLQEDNRFNYMASLGKMALEVAHKIDNPLHIIINYLVMMKPKIELIAKTSDDEKAVEFINGGIVAIDEESKKIAATVNELKRSALPIELSLSQVDLNITLSEALNECQESYIKPNCELTIDLGTLPEIIADKDLLLQALIEIVSNVAKDSSANGQVSIKTSAEAEQITISIEYTTTPTAFYQREKLGNEISAMIYTARLRDMGYGLRNSENIIAAHEGSKITRIISRNESEDTLVAQLVISLPCKIKTTIFGTAKAS